MPFSVQDWLSEGFWNRAPLAQGRDEAGLQWFFRSQFKPLCQRIELGHAVKVLADCRREAGPLQ